MQYTWPANARFRFSICNMYCRMLVSPNYKHGYAQTAMRQRAEDRAASAHQEHDV